MRDVDELGATVPYPLLFAEFCDCERRCPKHCGVTDANLAEFSELESVKKKKIKFLEWVIVDVRTITQLYHNPVTVSRFIFNHIFRYNGWGSFIVMFICSSLYHYNELFEC